MDLITQLRASLLASSLPPPSTTFLTSLITSRSPPPPLPSLLATAKARLLASDLTSSSLLDNALLSALPSAATSATAASVRLTRDTHVQVLDVEDLSLSRWEQVEALHEVARGERTSGRQIVRVDENANADPNSDEAQRPVEPSRRHDNATHRLVLQDCRGTRVYAVELRRLPRIGVRSTSMGEKMLLRAGTVVARGTVLLAPESCLLLGGRVDAWHDAWANSRLTRLEEAANH